MEDGSDLITVDRGTVRLEEAIEDVCGGHGSIKHVPSARNLTRVGPEVDEGGENIPLFRLCREGVENDHGIRRNGVKEIGLGIAQLIVVIESADRVDGIEESSLESPGNEGAGRGDVVE